MLERRTPMMNAADEPSILLFPVVEREMFWQTKAGEHVAAPRYKAIIRPIADRQPRMLNCVNSTYKVVPMFDLLTSVEEVMIKEIDSFKRHDVIIRDHTSHGGLHMWREYVFPNFKHDIGSKTPVGFRVIVNNSYGGSSIKLLAGGIEFYCSNGLVTGQFDSTYHRHTSGLEINNITANVRKAILAYEQGVGRWKQWVATPLNHHNAMEFLTAVAANPTQLGQLQHLYLQEVDDRGENLWALQAALTSYSSHGTGMRGTVDTMAKSLFERQTTVAKWMETKEWHNMELALA